ncbi:MAG: ATP-binding protein [Candidatus Micrarchaeaceae archaeon]
MHRGKSRSLKLLLGRYLYSLSNSVTLVPSHGSLIALHSLRWKKKRGKAFLLPSQEANPHIIIFGMSGQGKSTLLRRMLIYINAGGKPAIVFDAHNEHAAAVLSMGGRVLDASHFGINIFSLDGSSVGERIAELSQLFRSVYSLGYVQTQKLAECMWYAYRKCGASSRNDMQLSKLPSMRDIMGELGVFINNSKSSAEKGSLVHLRSRLSSLSLLPPPDSRFAISSLSSGITSFSLAGLRNTEVQLIYINELLRRLYINMKAGEIEKGVSTYIVIDEAQFIINDSDSKLVKRLMEEGRKYGVGVILATHMASRLPREIIANSSTFITFYSREPQEINYIANILSSGMSERAFEIKRMLSRLKKNEAIVLSYRIRQPSVVKTPDAKDVLKALFGTKPAREKPPYTFIPSKPVMLDSAVAGQEAGAQSMSINWNGKEERWVMRNNASLSIEHEVMVKKIFEELDAKGIKAEIIDNSSGPDLIAFINGKKIAIEYETGKKAVSSTASMIKRRLESFPFVVIVVNDAASNFYFNYFDGEKVKVLPAGKLGNLPEVLSKASEL